MFNSNKTKINKTDLYKTNLICVVCVICKPAFEAYGFFLINLKTDNLDLRFTCKSTRKVIERTLRFTVKINDSQILIFVVYLN